MRMVLRGSGCPKAERARTRAKTQRSSKLSSLVFRWLSLEEWIGSKRGSYAGNFNSNSNGMLFSQILDKLNKRLSIVF